MNKVILQLWEESNVNEGILSDGCSLHLNLSERDIYVKKNKKTLLKIGGFKYPLFHTTFPYFIIA